MGDDAKSLRREIMVLRMDIETLERELSEARKAGIEGAASLSVEFLNYRVLLNERLALIKDAVRTRNKSFVDPQKWQILVELLDIIDDLAVRHAFGE